MMKYSRENSKLIVIVGPTAIGKSELAIKLAQRYRAEIYSADSRQVYREMHIGTAKPALFETQAIAHHFIDCASIFDPYSAGHFVESIHDHLRRYFQHKNIGVLVGGTGFYVNAALYGLDEFPDIPDHIKLSIQHLYKEGGLSTLQNLLKQKDPRYFEVVDIYNPMRLMRALEVIETTGKTYSEYRKGSDFESFFDVVPIVLDMERQLIYDRINKRVDIMMDKGLLEEARSLFEFRHLPALNTVGYTELFNYLEGNTVLDTAVELIKRNSRRYAKRQMTWFNNKYPDWPRFSPDNFQLIVDYIDSEVV